MEAQARQRYDDHRQILIRHERLSRFYAFWQIVQGRADVFESPIELETFEAFMFRHESEIAILQDYNHEPDFLEELTSRLRIYQHEMPSFFHPSNSDPGQFQMGLVLFENFMRIADDCRRGQHIEPNGLVPDFDPVADFFADLACWERLMTRPEDRQRSMISGILAGLPAVDTTTLAEEDRSCPICMDRYTDIIVSPNTTAASSSAEDAVRLRCLHVFGRNCLLTWIQSGNMTCPFCRANVEDGTAAANDNRGIHTTFSFGLGNWVTGLFGI